MQRGRLEGIAVKPVKKEPLIEKDEILIGREFGLQGDARGRPGARQVTVISLEAWQAALEDIGQVLPWTMRRANLLVSGIKLEEMIGHNLTNGDCVLQITGETEPCSRMDGIWPGLQKALAAEWRGGATTRVMRDGLVRVGDAVSLQVST